MSKLSTLDEFYRSPRYSHLAMLRIISGSVLRDIPHIDKWITTIRVASSEPITDRNVLDMLGTLELDTKAALVLAKSIDDRVAKIIGALTPKEEPAATTVTVEEPAMV